MAPTNEILELGYSDDEDGVAAFDQAHSRAMEALRTTDLFFLTVKREDGMLMTYCAGQYAPSTIVALANHAVDSCTEIVRGLPSDEERDS